MPKLLLIMQAWLTPSKAAGLLPPLVEQQDALSQGVSSGQLQSPSERCESIQKTPSPSTPDQEHEATYALHLQYSPGTVSQEEEQPATAATMGSGLGKQCSGLSISNSPASPLSATAMSHGSGPGYIDSQAENPYSSPGRTGLSSTANNSQRKCHSVQSCDAAPWPMNRTAQASGSFSGSSSGSENAEALGLDPYTVRHLCLQELELLWSEQCNEVCILPTPPATFCDALAPTCMLVILVQAARCNGNGSRKASIPPLPQLDGHWKCCCRRGTRRRAAGMTAPRSMHVICRGPCTLPACSGSCAALWRRWTSSWP